MDQPAPLPPSPARQFWRTWRRDLIRGSVLFGLVVLVGLALSQVHVGIPVTLDRLRSMRGFDIDPDGNLFGPGRQLGDQWEWRGTVKPSQQVWIRNTNGPVAVVPGAGDLLEVVAEKSWQRSSPSVVELVAVPSDQGVTICAVWQARESNCGSRGEYQLHDVRRNDVAVRFTVKLPRGVKIDVSTVNGQLALEGATSAVEASTVNGRVVLHTASGPVKVQTVNGSVEARLDALPGGENSRVEIETVNGSVTAILPDKLNAQLEAQTVNGKVETDFPLQLTGRISPRHVRGTIGTGGATLKLNTVNGSIAIRQVGAGAGASVSDSLPPDPAAPAAPAAPRPPRATRRVTRVEAPKP